jgi:dynein heavy chain
MVEKWLSQVEQQMVQSVKDSCMMAVKDYFESPRSKWLLKWPGQVVICGNCIHWTAEVSEAIEKRRLPVSHFSLEHAFVVHGVDVSIFL